MNASNTGKFSHMRDRQLHDLPDEVIQMIALNLSVEEAKKLSLSARFLFSALDENFFVKRPDFNYKMRCLIFRAVRQAIDYYLRNDKTHPGYKNSASETAAEFLTALGAGLSHAFMLFPPLQANSFTHWKEKSVARKVRYDQGYHRAHCLRHIINNNAIPVELSFFAIYTFLHESNGVKLKQRMTAALAKHTNGKSLAYLENVVKAKFGDAIPAMSAAFLKEVHINSYDEYAAYDSYQFAIKHSWKNFLEELLSVKATPTNIEARQA